jgi:TPR repeat protein
LHTIRQDALVKLTRAAAFFVIAMLLASQGRAKSAAPPLTVAQLTRDGQSVASVPDVTLRGLDGTVERQGVRVGDALPDNVRVEVPARDAVTIVAGKSTATLEPGAIDTFHYTGSQESVAPNAGKVSFDDPLDFYHVSGPGFDASAHGTVYTVEVSKDSAVVTCTDGAVEATLLGSGSTASQSRTAVMVKRVDDVTANGNSSVTYMLGQNASSSVSLADDEKAAARGTATAEFDLGARYYFGSGVAKDYAAALHWFQLAAAQGNSWGQTGVGGIYFFGHGVPADYATALHWYQLAAAQGNSWGQTGVGAIYYYGYTVPQDYAAALHWYQLAAAQGNPLAESNIGGMYALGRGVPQDYATALHWFQLSAAQGFAWGQDYLGLMYASGRGVAEDDATALHWFQLSAAQGNPGAENNIGLVYFFGHGVPQDYATALHWFQLSAAQDYGAAEYNLAYMYDKGQGVPQDEALAQHWYQLAAAQGNVEIGLRIEQFLHQ